MILIYFLINWTKSHVRNLFHSFPNSFCLLFSNKFAEIFEGKLVTVLKESIAGGIFLDGIIR